MELNKRVGEYAAAIVRDAALLLADASNMNIEQQQFAGELKRHSARFVSFFNEHLTDFAELTHESIVLIHDMSNPLGLIEGYCELLLTRESDNLYQSQRQQLQQIKTAHDFILNTFIIWVNSEHEKGNQST